MERPRARRLLQGRRRPLQEDVKGPGPEPAERVERGGQLPSQVHLGPHGVHQIVHLWLVEWIWGCWCVCGMAGTAPHPHIPNTHHRVDDRPQHRLLHPQHRPGLPRDGAQHDDRYSKRRHHRRVPVDRRGAVPRAQKRPHGDHRDLPRRARGPEDLDGGHPHHSAHHRALHAADAGAEGGARVGGHAVGDGERRPRGLAAAAAAEEEAEAREHEAERDLGGEAEALEEEGC